MRSLLQKGEDPNEETYLLAYAIGYCPTDVCELLLDHGANPNSYFSKQLELSKLDGLDHTELIYNWVLIHKGLRSIGHVLVLCSHASMHSLWK